MDTRYRLDPSMSRFTVQAFAGGALSFFAHSPRFAVHNFTGEIVFVEDRIADMRMNLVVPAASLELIDRVKDADRREIEERMRREVLRTDAYPEIALQAGAASCDRQGEGKYRLGLAGRLSLCGVERPLRVDVNLIMCRDGVRLQGETGLRMPEFGIAPVTALAGAIRLKDEMKVWFDLAAVPEKASGAAG